MCYQKFHTCKYCSNQYLCELDNYICPTLNHDANMEMCEECEKKLEEKLNEIGIDDIDLDEIDFNELLKDDKE